MVLVPLVLGLIQVGLVLHVRNTLAAAATEGARYGANIDRTPADGAARTREQVERRDRGPVRPGRLGRPRDGRRRADGGGDGARGGAAARALGSRGRPVRDRPRRPGDGAMSRSAARRVRNRAGRVRLAGDPADRAAALHRAGRLRHPALGVRRIGGGPVRRPRLRDRAGPGDRLRARRGGGPARLPGPATRRRSRASGSPAGPIRATA